MVGEKKVAYTLSNSARGKMTPQWRLSLKTERRKKIWGRQETQLGETASERKKYFVGVEKAGLSKL